MTWLSFCARYPGPEWKQGYGTGPRTLVQIEGVVDHSMEGPMAGAYSVLNGPRQSSWTFSIPKVREPIQHYPLKAITWHCGLPGDRRADTSLIGNLTLVGKEHEGRAGEPWTENQIFWSAKIDVALRRLCPTFGANPPTLRLNMWEHNWLSATSCPSGRNLWEEKFALINELEDDVVTEARVKEIFREELGKAMAAHAVPSRHHDLNEIADHLPRLNTTLKATVAQIASRYAGGSTVEEILSELEVVLKRR
ncbi:hypothetical protein LCGC14_0887620 [marine sediment metagenome]|uniref:N-acetylmuramoyl-L-alanine amidase domain-containing protein n=1 Tax=marine sediment metagenome TaxID=412755 RepID=A0A0F9S735_9ZZZZ